MAGLEVRSARPAEKSKKWLHRLPRRTGGHWGMPMDRSVRALIGAQALMGLGALWALTTMAEHPAIASPVGVTAFTVVLVAMGRLTPLYVELRRHASWVAPTDGAYMVGLVALGPLGLVLAVGLAELATSTRANRALVKRVFNVVSITAGAAIGALVYDSAGGSAQPLQLRTWVAAVLALVTIAVWDTVVTAAVLSLTDRDQGPLVVTMRRMALPQAVALAVSVPFGLIALVLFAWQWPSLLLLVPVLALVNVSTAATLRRRSEQQRVHRLARAAAELVELVDTDDLLVKIAVQARGLVTGVAAVVVAVPDDGEPQACLVDDAGTHTVDAVLLSAVAQLVGGGTVGTTHGDASADWLDGTDGSLRTPGATLWAVHQGDPSGTLAVVVIRELASDGGESHRADVLATFTAQAFTALANVRLHTDLRRNLELQQQLGRRKDEFIANVSHELRTPLSSIGGALETLWQRGKQLSATQRDALFDVAVSNTTRLRGLIDDLLTVAERNDPEPSCPAEPVDIGEMLQGLERQFRPWRDGSLHVHQASLSNPVAVDAKKLRLILTHLLDNARKYAPNTPVELTATQTSTELRFVVADGGNGIAPTDRDRIFEPFVQLDGSSTRARGGLGLGLHLCRQLTTALGGQLTVDTAPAGGAQFTLTVPLHPTPTGRFTNTVTGAAKVAKGSDVTAPTTSAGDRVLLYR